MHILHLSDTHSFHRQLGSLPAADIIIHSGDISFAGTGDEIVDFINWFIELDYQYKIFIAGNHDFALEGKSPNILQTYLPNNCYYLYNSGVKINDILFWGIPFFLFPEEDFLYNNEINRIPNDTDILITHQPPHGILDHSGNKSFGSMHLHQKVTEIKPRYHLFGHIHDAYGTEKHAETTFSNAAMVDAQYQLVNNPILFEI